MMNCYSSSTPAEVGLKLIKDPKGRRVNSTLYKQIVGILMYLTATRPDVMHFVSLISRYIKNPTEMQLLSAKRIFRHLQGTKDFGILYKKGKMSELIGFTDSAIVQEIKIIEEAHRVMFSCLAQVLFHGRLRSNQSSLYQLPRLNL